MIEKIGSLRYKNINLRLFVLPKTKEFLYKKGISKNDLIEFFLNNYVKGLSFIGDEESNIYAIDKEVKILLFGATNGIPTTNPKIIKEKIPEKLRKGVLSTTTIYKNPSQNAVIFFKLIGVNFR